MNYKSQVTGSTRVVPIDVAMRLAAKAMLGGARRDGFASVIWDCAGDCARPYPTTTIGRPEAYGRPGKPAGKFRLIGRKAGHVIYVTMLTRCRKCNACLGAKRRMWEARALTEFGRCRRCWFGTLTFRPEVRSRLRYQAVHKMVQRAAGDEPDFAALASEYAAEVTKYLKRIRSKTGADLMYLQVCEQHKDGEPHFHLLIYEKSVSDVVTHKTLSTSWTCGFSNWKLANARSIKYVTKYVSKGTLTRIRASEHFGQLLHSHPMGGVLNDTGKGGPRDYCYAIVVGSFWQANGVNKWLNLTPQIEAQPGPWDIHVASAPR